MVRDKTGIGSVFSCAKYTKGSQNTRLLQIKDCLKSQTTCRSGHPEFISGSDIQCIVILKQVQDDGINDF